MSTAAIPAVGSVRRGAAEPALPDGFAIHNRSCEDMAEVADGSVSLVLTSPPYFVDTADLGMRPALPRGCGLG